MARTKVGKVLFPDGFTKGQLVGYYEELAPVLVPHLAGRALTLRRFPDGVDGPSFYEKRCPAHAPAWVPVVEVASASAPSGRYQACTVDHPATLVWLANLATVELHPSLSLATAPQRPTVLVFDLDPGAPAGVGQCAQVACLVRDLLASFDVACFTKTSGSKGLQVYVPLHGELTYEVTKPLAHAVAVLLQRQHPELVVSTMAKAHRPGRVLIDWSQNSPTKTTVAVYSLRARATPGVSAPLTWEEVEALCAEPRPPRRRPPADPLQLSPKDVLRRVQTRGDLFAPVASLHQQLPASLLDSLAALRP